MSALLCYPAKELSADRVCEVKSLDITSLHSFGSKRVDFKCIDFKCIDSQRIVPDYIECWRCLGIGYCGLVLLVGFRGQLAALKVRRTDAPQADFEKEALGLAIANQNQVGPQLLTYTPNFLIMNYAAGQPLTEWLATAPSRNDVISVVHDLMKQAFRLDQAGIDHGNLRCVTSHVVINNNRPTILDFSSASVHRRAANVTTLMQGLFWGTVIARQMESLGIRVDKERSIEQLRQYKKAPELDRFEHLLALLV